MKTLRISDNEVAVIAEDGSLNGSIRKTGTCFTFNNLQDAKHAWELLTSDALEYKEPASSVHLADLEMLSNRIDALETTLDGAQRLHTSVFRHVDDDDRDLGDEIEQLKVEQQELRRELEDVQGSAVCEAEVNDMIEEAVEEHERQYSDNLDEDHIHDLIAQFIMDDDAGTLRRKVVEIVADKLLGR